MKNSQVRQIIAAVAEDTDGFCATKIPVPTGITLADQAAMPTKEDTKMKSTKAKRSKKADDIKFDKPAAEKTEAMELEVEVLPTRALISEVLEPELSQTRAIVATDPMAAIRAARSRLHNVANGIREAGHARDSVEVVQGFMETIDTADALAEVFQDWANFPESRDKWFRLELPAIEEKLKIWAEGNDQTSQTALESLSNFKKGFQLDLTPMLWGFVKRIREVQGIRRYAELSCHMYKLQEERLIVRANGTTSQEVLHDAIQIGVGRGRTLFVPAMRNGQVPAMTQLLWRTLKDAEARCQADAGQRATWLADAREQSDDLTFKEVTEEGKDGKIFLPLHGTNRGVLLGTRHRNNRAQVKVFRCVGIYVKRPTDWIDLDAPESTWPDDSKKKDGKREIYHAVQVWKTAPVKTTAEEAVVEEMPAEKTAEEETAG